MFLGWRTRNGYGIQLPSRQTGERDPATSRRTLDFIFIHPTRGNAITLCSHAIAPPSTSILCQSATILRRPLLGKTFRPVRWETVWHTSTSDYLNTIVLMIKNAIAAINKRLHFGTKPDSGAKDPFKSDSFSLIAPVLFFLRHASLSQP